MKNRNGLLRIGIHALLCGLSFGSGLGMMRSGHASSGFVAHHGMSSSQLSQRLVQYEDSWRPSKLDAAITSSGSTSFSAIWSPFNSNDPAQNRRTEVGLSRNDFETIAITYRDQGFKPVSVCGYNPGNGSEPAFAAVWHHDPGVVHALRSHMTTTEYQTWFSHFAGLGYSLLDVEGYLLNGEVRFVAIWHQDGAGFSGRHGMSRHQFDWEVAPSPLQPESVGAFEVPGFGARFTKVWRSTPDVVRFSWGHMSSSEYQDLFTLKAGQGYCLFDIAAYPDEEGVLRYLSIWEAPDSDILKLGLPIGGVPNRDWVLVNYQDHDATSGMTDHTGGSWLYDNHNGTDLTLRNFEQMDQGVPVLASADGVVVETIDGNFDRNVCGVPGGSCIGSGNMVIIEHDNGQRTWYTHLRQNSIVVSVNDAVTRGQKIGEVGSSGSSSDAHLHFAVLNPPYRRQVQDGDLVDPFEGDFGNSEYLWMARWPYQENTLTILDAGTTDSAPSRLEYTERPAVVSEFIGPFDGSELVWFWLQWAGTVSSPDEFTVKLLPPAPGSPPHYEFSFTVGSSTRYGWSRFQWPVRDLANTQEGDWNWIIEQDGVVVRSSGFSVLDPISGNVNLGGAGTRQAVLRINGDDGGLDRTVTTATGQSLSVSLALSSSGPFANARYALWVWPGDLSNVQGHILTAAGAQIGTFARPTPFQPIGPQPLFCLRSTGMPGLVCRDTNEMPSPSRAPFSLTRAGGIGNPVKLTFQGLLEDQGSASGLDFSVTNAIVLCVE